MQRILNLRLNPPTPFIYCGRWMPAMAHYGLPEMPASPLGNPWKLTGRGMKEVAEVLAKYRRWLFDQIRDDNQQVMSLMREICPDTALACWCVDLVGEQIYSEPERCHCQVIFKAARWMKANGKV